MMDARAQMSRKSVSTRSLSLKRVDLDTFLEDAHEVMGVGGLATTKGRNELN